MEGFVTGPRIVSHPDNVVVAHAARRVGSRPTFPVAAAAAEDACRAHGRVRSRSCSSNDACSDDAYSTCSLVFLLGNTATCRSLAHWTTATKTLDQPECMTGTLESFARNRSCRPSSGCSKRPSDDDTGHAVHAHSLARCWQYHCAAHFKPVPQE